ncbi:MAG: signal recognition particle protein Srp54 [Euryarchaeota archaeon]|nr:signal recognition particle protein Srp54 [Euryarchaeota archaeon]
MSLDKLGSSLRSALRKIIGAPLVDEVLVKEVVKDIQRALITSDVNVKLVMDLSKKIEKRALEEKLPAGLSKREHVIKIVYDELVKFVGEKPSELRISKDGFKIMMIGIEGSGKTTSIAKLARFFQRKGYKPVLICADVHRLGAYEQLQQLAAQLNVPFHGNLNSTDAVKIVEESLSKIEKKNLVIIDTAGRHKSETELMDEMKKLAEVAQLNEKLLTIDATIGQQAGVQAKAFHEAIGITGVVLTKLDGAAKGGGALSAVATTGVPIKFIGVGEKIDEFELFDPQSFISRLLGMGDLKALLEKAEELPKEIKEVDVTKFLAGKFTLQDLYSQFEAMQKMGPLKKILQMVPGFGLSAELPEDFYKLSEEKLKKFRVILDSMTDKELESPEIINRSRMQRIARGSGTKMEDIKELLKQYQIAKRLFKSLRKGRFPALDKALRQMGLKKFK